MPRLLRKLHEQQLQQPLGVVGAGLHGDVGLQNQLHRLLAEAVGHAARGRHGQARGVALEAGQLHELLLPAARGQDDARVKQPPQLRPDGAEHGDGVGLHGVELLQLAERCLKILLDDGVADIEGLGAERRDDDRVDGPARDGRALLVGGDLVDLSGERGHEAVSAENEVLAQIVRDHLVVGAEMPRDPRAQIAL